MTWPIEVSVWFILALIGMVPTALLASYAFDRNKGWLLASGYVVYCVLMFPASFWIAG